LTRAPCSRHLLTPRPGAQVGVFWNGLHNSRVSLGSGLKGEL
jgi:hypothetical protein